MTHEDILRMAREADCLDDQHYGTVWADKLKRFATLVIIQRNKEYVEWKRRDRKEKRDRYAREKAARESL